MYYSINQDNNKKPNILLAISEVNLSKLVHIDVFDNNIESVEVLSRIRMPSLSNLSISNHPTIKI